MYDHKLRWGQGPLGGDARICPNIETLGGRAEPGESETGEASKRLQFVHTILEKSHIGKRHFQALRVPETRNRPLIGAAEKTVGQHGPSDLQRNADPAYVAVRIGDSKRKSRLKLKS
jgi:hypothetical protein